MPRGSSDVRHGQSSDDTEKRNENSTNRYYRRPGRCWNCSGILRQMCLLQWHRMERKFPLRRLWRRWRCREIIVKAGLAGCLRHPARLARGGIIVFTFFAAILVGALRNRSFEYHLEMRLLRRCAAGISEFRKNPKRLAVGDWLGLRFVRLEQFRRGVTRGMGRRKRLDASMDQHRSAADLSLP
jgi:hypothetical protein